MKDHLTKDLLAGYRERILDATALLAADDHLAGCEQCRSDLAALAPPDTVSAFALSFRSMPANEHLSFEELSDHLDDRLDPIAAEIVELHLGECSRCIEDLESLREAATAKAPQPSIPTQAPTFGESIRTFFAFPAMRFAIPLVLIGGTAAGVYFLVRPNGTPGENKTEIAEVNTNSVPPVVVESENVNAEIVEPEPSPIDVAAITIIDGNSELRIDAEGKMIGSFAGEYDARIAAAVRTGALAIASEAQRLKGSAGILMGAGDGKTSLRVRSPIGKIIATDRPQFNWSGVEGSSSYTVEVYDPNFNKVMTSPPVTGTQWTAGTALPRGREYTWQVTAMVNGETLRAPTRPAPDARFVVVSGAKLAEIERAKRNYGRSNLVLGILYAEAGLLDDAEREFQALIRKNPNSANVKRLLNKVRTAR